MRKPVQQSVHPRGVAWRGVCSGSEVSCSSASGLEAVAAVAERNSGGAKARTGRAELGAGRALTAYATQTLVCRAAAPGLTRLDS